MHFDVEEWVELGGEYLPLQSGEKAKRRLNPPKNCKGCHVLSPAREGHKGDTALHLDEPRRRNSHPYVPKKKA